MYVHVHCTRPLFALLCPNILVDEGFYCTIFLSVKVYQCSIVFLRSDWWLIRGVAKFIGGLFCRKAFGNTDYLYWIREELQKVCLYEADHTLPPLCSSVTALQATASASSGKGVL